MKNQVLIFLFSFCTLPSVAQSDAERGYPNIVNYSHTDFKASSMNFGVARDDQGLYYAANEDGVLVFDGYQWELVPIKKNKPVYWVEIGADGVIYVASSSEFGYMSDEEGRLKYVSLLDKIDDKYRDFEVVWEMAKTSREIVFRSKKYLFVKRGDEIITIPTSTKGFDVAYTVRDTVYLRERGKGFCKLESNEVKLLSGGDYYADIKLNIYLDYPGGNILLGSRSKGIFIYDHGKSYSLKTEADSVFKKYNIYHGCVTKDGNYALASSNVGVVIMDRFGKLLRFLDYKTGLPNNQILSVSALDDTNLWLGTGGGVSKVRYNAPLSYYDYKLGLRDKVTDIKRHNGKLYVSTLYGLFALEPQGLKKRRVVQANRKSLQEILSLDEIDRKLLIGSQYGLLTYQSGKFEEVVERQETRYVKVSKDQKRIYASIGEGHFGVYHKTAEGIQLEMLTDFIEPVKKVIEFDDHIVLVTGYGDLLILKLNMNNEKLTIERLHSYSLGNFNATKYQEKLMVFTPDVSFNLSMDGRIYSRRKLQFTDGIVRIDEVEVTPDDHIWICFENAQNNNYCEQIYFKDDSIKSHNYKFKTDFRVNTILSENEGISWFGGAGGLLRYDRRLAIKDETDSFKCLINKVIYEDDSVLFSFARSGKPFEFDRENVALKFFCFTNQVTRKGEMLYQYQLEGSNEEWSNWTTEPVKIFTHLKSGDYVFRARAKNSSNNISDFAEMEFSVMTPFYKSIYAIVLYLLVIIVLVYFIIVWRLNTARLANRQLEAKVKERTREVESQKEVLKQTNKTKDQLFSIIGHDLRSPLNSLESLAELIQHYRQEKKREKVDEMMGIMTLTVKNLRNLLDNLLTWTLNQSGKFNIRSSAIELQPFFEEVISVLQDAAKKKKIRIELIVEVKASYIGDRNSLSVIVRNLLSNAIKFTEEKGVINIKVLSTVSGIEFSVSDDGVGIPPDKLEEIYELSHSSYGTSNEKGTGLGLTLVKDFIELNQGTISVQSQLGEGATFSVFLPRLND